jgi:hypothetical protein
MEMLKLGPKGRAELGAVARKRIVENFGLAEMVARYEALYEERAAARRRAAR